MRQLAALYQYDNELYAMEGDGQHGARGARERGPLLRDVPRADVHDGAADHHAIMGFNYDMAQGVEYEIDLTRPAGHRIESALPRPAAPR